MKILTIFTILLNHPQIACLLTTSASRASRQLINQVWMVISGDRSVSVFLPECCRKGLTPLRPPSKLVCGSTVRELRCHSSRVVGEFIRTWMNEPAPTQGFDATSISSVPLRSGVTRSDGGRRGSPGRRRRRKANQHGGLSEGGSHSAEADLEREDNWFLIPLRVEAGSGLCLAIVPTTYIGGNDV